MNSLNVLSLFDGISCGQLALLRANIPVLNYFASEVDKYAIKVTQNNFTNTIQLGDVRNVSINEKIDLLIGGSPCQSFTFSGKRNGMTTSDNMEITTLDEYLRYKQEGFDFDGQSYLFWEYVRILKELHPRYFLLENVVMDKKWQKVISDALGVEPIKINSNLVSAQNRKRLYWTNIPVKNQPEDKGLLLKDIVIPDNDIHYHLSVKHLEGFKRSYNWKPCDLNNKSCTLLASYYKQPPHSPYIASESSESGYRRLSPIECERLQTLPDNYTNCISDTQRYKTIGNGWTVDVLAYIFSFLN